MHIQIPQWFKDFILNVPDAIIFLTVIGIIFLIIKQKGDPLKAVSWIMVFIALPVVGIGLYFFFGQNYRKQKIFSRKGISELENFGSLMEEQLQEIATDQSFPDKAVYQKKHIMSLAIKSSKALLSLYNRVTVLNNGLATFDAIIESLEKAQHHIHLEYYIIEDDEIAHKIRDILIRKAKEGVEVRLIYDDVGSWNLDEEFLGPLTDAGVEHYAFMPVRFPRFTNKINYRNHRKIIVVDGEVGFVGGLNIADRYIKGDEEVGAWRDTHLKVEGEVVWSLQLVFLTDWYFVSDKLIKNSDYLKRHIVNEKHLMQIVTSGPDSDWASIMQVYFHAISTARNHVYISTPYFLPNESILTALKTVALSGVDVKIMIPERSDSHMVYWASLSYVSELIETGINVYFYQAGFNHGKLLMVDGSFVSIGTANMDIRSFDQNFEINALIYDTSVADRMESYFLDDLKYCRKWKQEDWENRSSWYQFREAFARLFSPLF